MLIIGGGMAAAWAAVSAARTGAKVALVDKGFVGTSGVTATGGPNHWWVPPDPALRAEAIERRWQNSFELAEREWMARIIDTTWRTLPQLAAYYPFAADGRGATYYSGLRGPEYMRALRHLARDAGVRILDHHPALELLSHPDGSIAGAAGYARLLRRPWVARAGAVVIATGGCAFLSGGLGCDVLTGDGHLMAAELGAEMSGMEFSNSYAISPEFASVTKTAFYNWGTFYHEDGRVLEGAGAQRGRSVIARALLTERVFCALDQTPADLKGPLRATQPNFFLPFDRAGIDPFTDRFPVTMRLEGTVRGTGGLRVTSEHCATTVPGLYAAGDAATRELICGGFTGGGSHNAAWSISSGTWAGRGAAVHARAAGLRTGEPAGGAGRRPTGAVDRDLDWRSVTRAVQEEVHPYDRNLFRTAQGLTGSLDRLDDLWGRARAGLVPTGGEDEVRTREAAAMLAHARWMYRAALDRSETRGMHKRMDRPEIDPHQWHRKLTGGVDEVWTRVDPIAPVSALAVSA